MLDKMKRYIAIGECPVGEVKKSLSPLPPPDHVYGYSAKPDSAGVGVGNQLIILFSNINSNS